MESVRKARTNRKHTHADRGVGAANTFQLQSASPLSVFFGAMALGSLEYLRDWDRAHYALLYSVVIAAVSATLIALSYLGNKE